MRPQPCYWAEVEQQLKHLHYLKPIFPRTKGPSSATRRQYLLKQMKLRGHPVKIPEKTRQEGSKQFGVSQEKIWRR